MKLADLTIERVLSEFASDPEWRPGQVYDELCQEFPEKIVYRRFEQMHEKGLLEYGVSLRTAWLTVPPITTSAGAGEPQ